MDFGTDELTMAVMDEIKNFSGKQAKTGKIQAKTGKNREITGRETGKKQANSGSFSKGRSGNPAGRPKGALTKVRQAVYARFDQDAEAIAERMSQQAYWGNSAVMKHLMSYALPMRSGSPVSVAMPEIGTLEDVAQMHITLLKAVAEGSLTPREGLTISSMTQRLFRSLKMLGEKASACEKVS